MAHPILMPKPGQMTEECTVVSWLKAEGDPVAKGDVLFEIETDKSNMDVESFHDGVLLRIVVAAGETAPVNSVCGYVGQPGEEIPETPPSAGMSSDGEETAPAPAGAAEVRPVGAPAASDGGRLADASARVEEASVAAPKPVAVPAPPAGATPAAGPAPAVAHAGPAASPRAARLAASLGVDLRSVTGSGPAGRITERDVERHAAGVSGAPSGVLASVAGGVEAEILELLRATGVTGTGPGGSITAEDIRLAAAERPQPFSRMRQVIARRLTESWTTTPHFTVTVPVDMTGLVDFRADLKRRGVDLTITDFIAHAVAQTLVEFPAMNSSTDGSAVRWHAHVNLGIAVALGDGLIVPVVRDAETLTLTELHERASAAAQRARGGTLRADELSGGTFTISNMGMLDVESFTAIINPGEAGILAVSSTRPTPVVVGSEIAVRQIMRMTISADHRLVDGATGARFLNAVRARLEDVDTWRRLTAG